MSRENIFLHGNLQYLLYTYIKKMYFYRKQTSETTDDEDSMLEGEEIGVALFLRYWLHCVIASIPI